MTNANNSSENISVFPNKQPNYSERRSHDILLKIEVALKVNYYKKQTCKIIFKEDNELKFVCMALKSLQNNFVILENDKQIHISKIIDINY